MNEQPKDYAVTDYPESLAKRLRTQIVEQLYEERRFIKVSASELLNILTDYLDRVKK